MPCQVFSGVIFRIAQIVGVFNIPLAIVCLHFRLFLEKWRVKMEQLHYDRMTLDTDAVTKWWKPCDGEKADIADVVVRIINEIEPLTSIEDVADKMPQAKPLIDKLNLEIDNDREPKE